MWDRNNSISDLQSDSSEESTADKFLEEMDQLNSLNEALQSFSSKNVKVGLELDPGGVGWICQVTTLL